MIHQKKKKKQESTKEKLHATGEFTGKGGWGSTVSFMPFSAKKVLKFKQYRSTFHCKLRNHMCSEL